MTTTIESEILPAIYDRDDVCRRYAQHFVLGLRAVDIA
jgi:hypothetical protein